jgi:YidC/Oxa1 family membrane protein insertase
LDIGALFNNLIVGPASQLLMGMADLFGGNYGIAIIVFGILVKMVTLPLTIQQLKSSRAMQKIQPLMKDLQEKYKDDREALAQKQMELYREHGVNPLGGCLPLIIQLPVLWGLYRAIYNLANQGALKEGFLWIDSLARPEGFPYILIALMVASQFLYQRLMTPPTGDDQQQSMQKAMQFMPLIFAFIFINLPAGLVLYYMVFNVVSVLQQVGINKWTDLREEQQPALPPTAASSTSDDNRSSDDGKVQGKADDREPRRRRRSRS